MWARIENIPDAELWETHRALRANLVNFVRREVSAQRQAMVTATSLCVRRPRRSIRTR
jgi:hypothetical protein